VPWPYATGDDAVIFADVRVLKQLLSDSDEDVPEASVPDHPILAEALKAGAADMDQELTEHLRYDVRAMMKLAEPRVSGPDPGVWLRKMNTARAIVHLQHRRVRPAPEADQLAAPLLQWADEQLARVHAGKNVLVAPPDNPAAMSDAEMKASIGSAAESGLVDKETFDPNVPGGLIHPRMGAYSPRRDSYDTLNEDFRDGGL
jgi:hypothetical protein